MTRSPWNIFSRPRARPRPLTWRGVIVSIFTLLGRLVGDLATGRSSRASTGEREPKRTGRKR